MLLRFISPVNTCGIAKDQLPALANVREWLRHCRT